MKKAIFLRGIAQSMSSDRCFKLFGIDEKKILYKDLVLHVAGRPSVEKDQMTPSSVSRVQIFLIFPTFCTPLTVHSGPNARKGTDLGGLEDDAGERV